VPTLRIQNLLNDAGESLQLELCAGQAGLGRRISAPRIQKPGLALSGYTAYVHPERMQILGLTEISYLGTLPAEQARDAVDRLASLEPACVVVTRGLEVPPALCEAGDRYRVPVLRSALLSSVFINRVVRYLEDHLAPQTSLHGVLMDVLGVGILLLGKSGIGKSEAALDLVMKGYRLVADDIVDIRRRPPNTVFGSGSEIIRHHMEIRGLGIINVKDLFGISAVRDTKKIELVIELVEWNEEEEYDRLGVEELRYRILEVDISMLRIPVRPGRNMTAIIEVAARNQLLKIQGHHSAREFQERLNRAIAEAQPPGVVASGDEVE
jgi:HPr kinase/phosphorylase